MSNYHYAEILSEAPEDAREAERAAIQRSIDMLCVAREKGASSREAIDALYYLDRLWSLLLDDLADAENRLPNQLRASLISIGIWILREIESIRNRKTKDFNGLIEVSNSICAGLGAKTS